jgi:WD40 repeat protein
VQKDFTLKPNYVHALARVVLIALFVACGQAATQKPVSNGENGTLEVIPVWSRGVLNPPGFVSYEFNADGGKLLISSDVEMGDFESDVRILDTNTGNTDLRVSAIYQGSAEWSPNEESFVLTSRNNAGYAFYGSTAGKLQRFLSRSFTNWVSWVPGGIWINENYGAGFSLLNPETGEDLAGFWGQYISHIDHKGSKFISRVTSENPEDITYFVRNGSDGSELYQFLLKDYPRFTVSGGWNRIVTLGDSQKRIQIRQAEDFELIHQSSEIFSENQGGERIDYLASDFSGETIAYLSYDSRLSEVETNSIRVLNGLGQEKTRIEIPENRGITNLNLSPNGRFLAVWSSKEATIYSTETGQIYSQVSYQIKGDLKWTPDSRSFALLVSDQEIQKILIYDAINHTEIVKTPVGSSTPTGHRNNIYDLFLKSAGQQIVSAGRDGSLVTYELETGYTFTQQQKIEQKAIYAARVSPDKTQLATAGEDGNINIWNLADQSLIATLGGHSYTIRDLNWSTDGQRIISGAWDNTVRIWNVETQTLETTLTDHANYVNAVQYHPNGSSFASASSDGAIRLRDVNTGTPTKTLQPDAPTEVYTIAHNKTGAILASGSADHRVRLWNTETGVLETILTGHLGAVRSMVWLREDILITGGADGRIIGWNTTTKKMVLDLEPGHGIVFALVVSADGKQLYVGYADGFISTWSVN